LENFVICTVHQILFG